MYRKANLIISVLTAMSWLTDVSLSGTRQADSWDISLSDIAVDPICRTSLDSRCKEDPEKGEKIESPGYRFLWYLSVFLVNLVLAILLAAGICLAGYTLAIYNEV